MRNRPIDAIDPIDSPPAVEAGQLVKLFGATPALVKVDLRVPAGSVCAATGDNGAGKTTLLRILATAARPTSGWLRIHGVDAVADPIRVRSMLDFVPAGGGSYPELTAAENLRFAAAMRGAALQGEIELALRRVGLSREADVPVRELSTGMTRRLSLARLLVTRPRLALLDEPYASLDEEGRELVDELVDEFRAEGRTTIVATHERARVRALADHVVLLRHGLVVPRETVQPAPAAAAWAQRAEAQL